MAGREYVKDFYDHFSKEFEEETKTNHQYRRNPEQAHSSVLQNENANKKYGRGRSQNRLQKRPKDSRNKSHSPRRYAEKNSEKQQVIDRFQLVDLELKDPENIIMFFSKNKYALDKLLSDLSDFNMVVLFLRVISKLCASSFKEYKSKIINQISDKYFLQRIQIHIRNVETQNEREKRDNVFFWEHQRRFWEDLIILYNTVLYVTPKTAIAYLPEPIKNNICTAKNTLVNNFEDLEEIIKLLEILQLKLEAAKLKKDSFRQMNIYPNVKEITNRVNPQIQPIKREGGYNLVETYLDIHFRLLREDYIRSLRNGICTYLENHTTNEKTKQYDIRIYENVKFVRPHVAKDRVGILVNYSKPVKELSSENKQFMYGALVCFTKDNFQNIVYGTVVGSDTDQLLSGFVVVDVQDAIFYGENYLMVESTIHFETYYHILKALQNMKDDNFPMKKYIIDVSSKVESPAFLNDKTTIRLFPKKSKVDKKDEVIVNGNPIKSFKMLSDGFWPPKEYFKLNSSQFVAFKAALTSEFSVIQGPPGTGKTYTTHKIVEFLLKNKNALKYEGPILVLCYTNHALDQFLEGILPFCDDIVRVGSQSKNVKMDDFNLRHHRRKIENDGDSYCKDLFEAEREKYDQCIQKLQCLQNLLEDITCKVGILDFQLFKTIDDKLKNSWFDKVGKEEILQWLLSDANMKPMEVSFGYPREVIQKPFTNEEKQETKIIIQNKTYDSETDFVKNCVLTLAELKTKIEDLRANNGSYNKQLQEYERKEKHLEWRLNQTGLNFNLLQKVNYNCPFNIPPNERWELYRCWVHRLHLQAYEDISVLDEEYRAAKRRYQEVQQIIDVYIMQEKSVIGMTTTAAARLQPVLQTLKCEIVIVEEAAEVLESHIVAALTNHCQQLILIGDHLQLRPNTSQYVLAKQYNLEISLFERMINNGIHYYILDVQHRMRPEFSKLIIPAIYPNLQNNDNVMCYPSVRGLAKNLYFITHNQLEERLRESTSHKNIYEAFFIINFACYLVKQGYTTEEITVLTTYVGQLNLLMKVCDDYPHLKNIRITTVDNFQGEENKIILLSLVRSNEKENIGFLKIENRVCVALSRAKEGFYMIGNMSNLEKDSVIWPKIIDVLTEQNSIGPYLPLKCQIHENETLIGHYTDFKNILDGGCTSLCNELLKCGHKCKQICHLSDRKHEFYCCKENCKKTICYRSHFCPKLCSEICADYCKVPVEKFLKCGHKCNMACSKDIKDQVCETMVTKTLICGHMNSVACNADTSKVSCKKLCNQLISCGHICKKLCHLNYDPNHQESLCREPCTKIKRDCSSNIHKCTRQCYQMCEICTKKVLKTRTLCNHQYIAPCNIDVNKMDCTKICEKIMQCGHKCNNKCNEPCGNCQAVVEKMVPTCGHTILVQCGLVPQRYMCRNKCPIILKCGHRCKKNCNEECACSKCNCTIL